MQGLTALILQRCIQHYIEDCAEYWMTPSQLPYVMYMAKYVLFSRMTKPRSSFYSEQAKHIYNWRLRKFCHQLAFNANSMWSSDIPTVQTKGVIGVGAFGILLSFFFCANNTHFSWHAVSMICTLFYKPSNFKSSHDVNTWCEVSVAGMSVGTSILKDFRPHMRC